MPYDGNGNFIRAHNWVADAANAIDISAPEMDQEDNGFASGLSNAVTRDGQGRMGVDFLPSVDNTLNLGSGVKRWLSINGIPVSSFTITQASISALLNPQTQFETNAGVTPVNLLYPAGNVLRYGTNTTPGTTDMTTAIQNCVTVCGLSGDTCFIPAGTYLITQDILVPVGVAFLNSSPFTFDIKGAGREQTIIKAGGGGLGFTNAMVYYNGVTGFKLCGRIADLTLDANAVALSCLVFANCDMPRTERCIFKGSTGRAVWFNTCIMPRIDNGYTTNAASGGTQACIEFLSCTTMLVLGNYISSNASAVAGMRVDKSNNFTMIGGAIESSGFHFQVGSYTDTTTGCVGGTIINTDFEKPNDHYLEFGYGMSVSAFVQAWDVPKATGFPSGAASVPYAVKCNRCSSIRFGDCNWSQNSGQIATYWLEGNTNLAVVIEASRELYGQSWPWVMQNSAQILWATPRVDFNSLDAIGQGCDPEAGVISGATASIAVSASQGGIYRNLLWNNGGATTVTSLTGGVRGMEITMISVNGNTTLTHSTSTANQFNLTLSGAVNLTLTANKPYKFYHNGTNWYQVTN